MMGGPGQRWPMSTVRHRECLFCHQNLRATEEHPVNLAFMDHIEAKPKCHADFEQWTVNMRTDFKGD